MKYNHVPEDLLLILQVRTSKCNVLQKHNYTVL